MAMNLQGHHVIPEDLRNLLWEKKGIEWDTFFSGVTVDELQEGPHPRYTKYIWEIIEQHLTAGDLPTLQSFAKNLINLIQGGYKGTFPNDIPKHALEGCFPNVTPQSQSGRPLKPVFRD